MTTLLSFLSANATAHKAQLFCLLGMLLSQQVQSASKHAQKQAPLFHLQVSINNGDLQSMTLKRVSGDKWCVERVVDGKGKIINTKTMKKGTILPYKDSSIPCLQWPGGKDKMDFFPDEQYKKHFDDFKRYIMENGQADFHVFREYLETGDCITWGNGKKQKIGYVNTNLTGSGVFKCVNVTSERAYAKDSGAVGKLENVFLRLHTLRKTGIKLVAEGTTFTQVDDPRNRKQVEDAVKKHQTLTLETLFPTQRRRLVYRNPFEKLCAELRACGGLPAELSS